MICSTRDPRLIAFETEKFEIEILLVQPGQKFMIEMFFMQRKRQTFDRAWTCSLKLDDASKSRMYVENQQLWSDFTDRRATLLIWAKIFTTHAKMGTFGKKYKKLALLVPEQINFAPSILQDSAEESEEAPAPPDIHEGGNG